MSLTAPKDTLAFQGSRPLRQLLDLRAIESAHIAARVKAFLAEDKTPDVAPEAEALWFYGMNHGLGQIVSRYAPYEPLPDPVVTFLEAYHRELAPRAMRAFCYLLLICTRECRHLKNKGDFKANPVHGPAAAYLGHVPDSAGEAMKVFCKKPPPGLFGPYLQLMRDAFYLGTWSSGYGGPSWGVVADCLCRFGSGETSAEVMLDTVWTLAHNNGPIFNKGMLYGSYGKTLTRILDVQRSGQVPELILTDPIVGGHVDEALSHWMGWLRDGFPGAVGPYVDWWQAEALGAKAAYPAEKQAQEAAFGPSPAAQKAQQIAAEQAKAAALAAAEAEAAHAKTWFLVMPGLEVEKLDRAA